jgi:GxxExxY protein
MYPDRNEINELSHTVIGSGFTVLNTFGVGLLEKVYENALAHEVRKRGLTVEQQRAVRIHYDGVIVGEYFADMIVEDRLIVELKVAKAFEDVHTAQCLTCLKATGLPLGLLLNFGETRLEIKRIANGL